MRLPTHFLTAAVFGLCLLFLSHVAAQTRSGEQVRNALSDQDNWLSGQANQPGWNKYLRTAELKQQLEKGPDADAVVVKDILQKYQAREPGLRLSQFESTRKALVAWIKDLSQPKAADLPAMARAAKSDYKPVEKSTVMERQVALASAVRRLDRYLKGSGSNGASWRKFLGLDDLQTELKKDLNADPKILNAFATRYSSGFSGLELPQFRGVTTTLRPYAGLLAAFQNSQAREDYDKNLDALAASLETAAKSPATFDRRELGELLDRISKSGQAPGLVAAVRGQDSQSNLLVHVSSDIVVSGINDQIDEQTPIKDVILGTDVEGSGHTTGQVRAALVPNRDKAIVEIGLTGQTKSKTVGYHGMVTVFSHGTTQLAGKNRVEFDEVAFIGDPASAQCCTNNEIDCIDVCAGRLITRIATNRVYGSKDEAEEIAGEHAEARLENRMDSRTGTLMANLNRSFDDRFRNPLLRRDAFPQQLSFSTTSDWLNVVGLQARANELGATTPPPDAASNTQLSIRLHESLVDNLGGAVEAGRAVRSLAYRRSVRDAASMRYEPTEFNDYLQCLAEAAAPADHRDNSLVVTFDQFQSLMKDRYSITVTQAEYDTLTRAVFNASLTEDQFNRYLAGLSRESVSYNDVMKFLADVKRGDVQVNYAGMTFADEQPVDIQFRDGTARLVLHIKSTTQPNLDNNGQRVVNPYPAEVYVTYKLTLEGGVARASRIDGEFGVKGLPMPGDAEANLSFAEKTRRSTLITKTLPRRFFGVGEAPAEDKEANSEPIFPQQLKSEGMTLRGRWAKLGQLPWTQLVSKDGWLAVGWTLPAQGTSAESASSTSGQF
ncbi:MAG TPA: hypothetical protein VFE46_08605 [Pirellulales bacterium]|jgi:hypothetical protein|nr:hypothetical protein [Pirellulales bacterium]